MSKLNLSALKEDTIQGYTELGKVLTTKIFSVKDAGINSKIFHSWKSKGLVDFAEKKSWTQLTLVEYLWLRVLETMRKLGCSVLLMQKIYNALFTKAYKENLAAQNLQLNFEWYDNLSKIRVLTNEEAEIFESLKSMIKDPLLKMTIRDDINYFYEMVLHCLKYQADAGLIIFEDEKFTKFVNPPYQQTEAAEKVRVSNKPHIYIPISNYIIEFLEDEDKEAFLTQTGLLSEDEYRVIREIRNKNVKAITITFNDTNHKLEKIECDKKGLIKGEDAKKVMALLGLKNYSGIELNTRDGKTLSFTHTEKKLF